MWCILVCVCEKEEGRFAQESSQAAISTTSSSTQQTHLNQITSDCMLLGMCYQGQVWFGRSASLTHNKLGFINEYFQQVLTFQAWQWVEMFNHEEKLLFSFTYRHLKQLKWGIVIDIRFTK